MSTFKNKNYFLKYVEINVIKIAIKFEGMYRLIYKHKFAIQYVEYVHFRQEYLTLGQGRNMQLFNIKYFRIKIFLFNFIFPGRMLVKFINIYSQLFFLEYQFS